MLRLLLVALPLVVASPAAFDAQEIDALHIEVQFPLQIEVRSPPESRPLRPAATRDQHDSPRIHTLHSARTTPANRTRHNGRAAAHYNAGKTIHPTIFFVTNLFRAQGYQPTTGVPPSPAGYHTCVETCGAASVGPAAAGEAVAHAARARARGRARERDVCSRARRGAMLARCNLRWPSARASAPPRLFC